jgi:addiction module RelE/StbE family toxin
MRIVYTPHALRYLRRLQHHIGEHNPAAAFRMAGLFCQRIAKLADHPRIGRPGRVDGTRGLVITGTPYLVAYRIADQAVFMRWPEQR